MLTKQIMPKTIDRKMEYVATDIISFPNHYKSCFSF